MEAKGETRYKSPDMVVKTSLVHGVTRPLTLQSRGCGGKGDYIAIPYNYLLGMETRNNPGAVLAHEFVKLRLGIFDEIGFPGDDIYPEYYRDSGRIFPTGNSDTPVMGTWLSTTGQEPCTPDREKCVFQPQGPNDQVKCSLGYLPTIPSVKKYCQSNILVAPTKHNAICNGQSVREVIENSDDYTCIDITNHNQDDKTPEILIVQEKTTKYVLLLEISSSMADKDDWKFINKAAQKLLRYDLPDSAEVAVVTFSNTSKVEAPLTVLKGSRSHLADIVPDKYRLAQGDERCLVCGFKTVMTEVLQEHKEGAHVILVTRGKRNALSINDEKTIKEYAEYYQVSPLFILKK